MSNSILNTAVPVPYGFVPYGTVTVSYRTVPYRTVQVSYGKVQVRYRTVPYGTAPYGTITRRHVVLQKTATIYAAFEDTFIYVEFSL